MAGLSQYTQFINFTKFLQNLKSFNFSLYGRYIGYLNVILCFALGISNLFHANLVIIFAIISIVQSFILIFIELPFLLKICPLSENFINFITRWETNGYRTLFYLGMAAVQYCSCIFKVTSLLVVAVFLTLSSISYLVAYMKKQDFSKSAPESVIKNPIMDTMSSGKNNNSNNKNKNINDLDDPFDIESGINAETRQVL